MLNGLVVAFAVWASSSALPQNPGEIVAGAVAERVDQYLSRLVPYGFSGAVLVARDGRIVLEKGYGMADREAHRPYTADMVSCIGSVTKQFTAAAILRLEMDGKLKTSDPVSKYLPGVPSDKKAITIHHLLTHTAGLSGDLGGSDEEPVPRNALVTRVLSAPLVSAPGERFEYSNEGYSLAGAIVERVSGTGYESYLREHLFLPAGMKETGYLMPAWPLARLPIGYTEEGKPWGRVYRNGWLPDGPGWYLRANGGIHSTLSDLYRWHLALESAKVLSAEAVRSFQTGHVQAMDGERYAYGWGVRTTRRGTRVISHNGGNGFMFTDFRRYPDEKTVIIAMSNQPVIPATQLAAHQLESLVFDGATVVMPPVSVSVSRGDRERHGGRYTLDGGGSVTIRATADALEAESENPALIGALPVAPPGGRFVDLETRTMGILQAAAGDDFQPLFHAFHDDRPFEVVQGNQRRFWAGWRAEFGEFRALQLLGTSLVSGDPAVAVRARFEKGGPVLQLIWGPRRLVGFRIVPNPAVRLTAEAPDSWVYYSYRAPALVRFAFGSDGSVKIATAAGVVTGRKQQ